MKRMQHNSFFLGCNHLNRDITTDARTGYLLYPVQDIDGGGHGSNVNVDDTLSLLFGGICFRQLKETLKHTMLVHESVFESQIHELHRLYQRQKELMMEMEGSRQQDEEEALYLNSSVPSPTTHWMSSSVSIYQTRNFPCEQQLMPNQLTEMNLEDHHKTAVSSIVLKKQKRRSYVKGKRKSDHQHIFSECEAKEDLQVKLDEVSDQEGDCMVVLKKNRRSKPIEAFTWGAKSKRRRRGSRIPALDFQPMIIDQ